MILWFNQYGKLYKDNQYERAQKGDILVCVCVCVCVCAPEPVCCVMYGNIKWKIWRPYKLCAGQRFSGNDEPGVCPLAVCLETALD